MSHLEDEIESLKQQSEGWRRAHLAWQDWANGMLRAVDLQIEGGELGDSHAREVLGLVISDQTERIKNAERK